MTPNPPSPPSPPHGPAKDVFITAFPPTRAQVEKWFTHGKAFTPEQGQRITTIHDAARTLALLMFDTLPDNNQKWLALIRLEESVSWANTSISRE
jgi:hypothetical protein